MCGITGFFNLPDISNKNSIDNLFSSITNRGPDLNKYLVEKESLFLLFSRLAINDLSEAGHQPILSKSGNSIMIFNGEIYNHNDIREKINSISNINWSGHSDTETLIEAFELYGFKILDELEGMFSICFYDRASSIMHLVNDRFGEKPLYYTFSENSLFFSSDIKSFAFKKREINKLSMQFFFRDNCIKYPLSIWNDVSKIKPAEIISLQLDFESKKVKKLSSKIYWDYKIPLTNIIVKEPIDKSVDQLDELLNDTIQKQLIADVPVGCFLSGGIDSSLITAIACNNTKHMKTFSIGFNDINFDESRFSKDIAKYLNTDHYVQIFTKKDAKEIIKNIPFIYGEPYSDSSQLPTTLLSNLASKHVKVSLTGDGGDELFGGYHRYNLLPKIWKISKIIPRPLKIATNILLRSLSPYTYRLMSSIIKFSSKKYSDTIFLEAKLEELFEASIQKNFLNMSIAISNHLPLDYKDHVVKNITDYKENLIHQDFYDEKNVSKSLMEYDIKNYLPNDLLVKTDRASMHFGLETRMPFLDHRIYNFSRSLPMEYKINKGQNKIILKKLLYRYIPKKLFDRPKRGFVVPLTDILLDDRKWIDDLLNEKKIKSQNLLNYDFINQEKIRFFNGNYLNQYILWDIIMFQQWVDFNQDKILVN